METDVDRVAAVAETKVVHHGGFVEEGQVCHVLDAVELGRVHLAELVEADAALLESGMSTREQDRGT